MHQADLTTLDAAPGMSLPDAQPTGAPRGFTIKIAIAQFGLMGALYTPALVTLALRVAEVDPANKTGSLSLVLGVGALFALVANPLFGRLSDRTTSRFGRRRPWMIGGAVGGLLGLALVAFAPSIAMILVGWIIAQTAFNACLASIQATVADLVPSKQLGNVSGAIGFAQTATIIVCTPIATLFADVKLKFLLPGLLAVVLVAYFAIPLPDKQLTAKPGRFSVKEFIGSLWTNPVKNRDFGWAWLSRFLVTFGAAGPTSYLAYYLMSDFHVSASEAASQVTLLVIVSYAVMAAASVVGGWLSDRFRARKPFLIVSSLIQFASLILLAFAPSFSLVMVSQIVFGIGVGIFYAVDLALCTEVLPSKADAAKDLGVMNIAIALPQAIAPLVASLVLGIGGENYQLFFAFSAVVSLVGTLTVPRIRNTR